MIEETGTVMSVETGFAEVETIRTSSCTSCRARHGCGHHAIAQVSPANRMRMKAVDPLSVEVGQRVVIGIPEDTLLQASVWMYLIPLLGMVFGAILPALWTDSNELSVLLSLLGFVGGLWFARHKANRSAHNQDFYPKVLRIESVQDEVSPLLFSP
ncbi:SoxR reducing system RseC family protein [Marinomonas aquiplantarum]|uniref:RseC/MucC-like positive regulator of sigma(E) n=1 Tax=Marinomonas aquiplantarum TaxID=491951 RepID=A0A366D6K9_9GAMM|nr:SoxR reducing system RseC family protein [Marinomonas aquiplantarum]RBO84928.1 RseC/MucC-like positive regulator of sigma(E) [Marinomonas aquiplantarum]